MLIGLPPNFLEDFGTSLKSPAMTQGRRGNGRCKIMQAIPEIFSILKEGASINNSKIPGGKGGGGLLTLKMVWMDWGRW